MNSKLKGKRGELELVNELKKYGFDVKRGFQFVSGKEEADVVGIEGLHIECKRVEKGLNLENALAQSRSDSNEGELPVVIHRKNREGWKVTLSLEDFIDLWRKTKD